MGCCLNGSNTSGKKEVVLEQDEEAITKKEEDEVKVAAKTGNFALNLDNINTDHSNRNMLFVNNEKDLPTNRSFCSNGSKRKLGKSENFNEHIFRLINKCRSNPSDFAKIIEQHIQFIQEENGHFYYVRKDLPKIALKEGEKAFRDLIERLRNTSPLNPLEMREDLHVTIPENQEEWAKKEYLASAINEVKHNSVGKDYKNFQFHFDIGSPRSEDSFVIQLVDDTSFKGARTNNLLNPNFKYIGINSKKEKIRKIFFFL
jgi:hypothetical protein